MSARRHPSDETLAVYAAGSLAAGPRLIVETHAHGCPECRARIRVCEAIGGALLDEIEPDAPTSDRLSRALAGIAAAPARIETTRRAWTAPFPGAPETLRRCRIGPWRCIRPGLRIASVTPAGESKASAMLMRVGAGRQMPNHTHSGVEYMQVLTGAYTDANGRYAAGDYDEADGEVIHQPHAEPTEDCICLTAVEGRLRLTSFVGRLAEWIIMPSLP